MGIASDLHSLLNHAPEGDSAAHRLPIWILPARRSRWMRFSFRAKRRRKRESLPQRHVHDWEDPRCEGDSVRYGCMLAWCCCLLAANQLLDLLMSVFDGCNYAPAVNPCRIRPMPRRRRMSVSKPIELTLGKCSGEPAWLDWHLLSPVTVLDFVALLVFAKGAMNLMRRVTTGHKFTETSSVACVNEADLLPEIRQKRPRKCEHAETYDVDFAYTEKNPDEHFDPSRYDAYSENTESVPVFNENLTVAEKSFTVQCHHSWLSQPLRGYLWTRAKKVMNRLIHALNGNPPTCSSTMPWDSEGSDWTPSTPIEDRIHDLYMPEWWQGRKVSWYPDEDTIPLAQSWPVQLSCTLCGEPIQVETNQNATIATLITHAAKSLVVHERESWWRSKQGTFLPELPLYVDWNPLTSVS